MSIFLNAKTAEIFRSQLISLGEKIRTSGLLNPIQARYQTAPHPDIQFVHLAVCLANDIYIITCASICQHLFSHFSKIFFNFLALQFSWPLLYFSCRQRRNQYAKTGRSGGYHDFDCLCGLESCQCFIQLGDEGPAVEFIQNALIAQGYLNPRDDAAAFDERTRQAVIRFQQANSLSPTGVMDDDTLTLLLFGMLPDALDAVQPFSSTLPMWIPTDGGIRHHDKPDCCGMLDPRLVSQRNALAMNMLHCGRCKPAGYVKPIK